MIKINALEDHCTLLANLNANRLTRQAFYLSATDVALLLQRFLRCEIDAVTLSNVADSLSGNDLVKYEADKEPVIQRTLEYVSCQGLPPNATTLVGFIAELTARD